MKRAFLIIMALLLGMLGLFMSLCGGGVFLMSLGSAASAGVLIIALPSLLLGIGLVWLGVRILRRVPNEPPPPVSRS